jgi:decaprenylphospho-beta-D-erythro-pentofuranosid-2-ulose 2-reductase
MRDALGRVQSVLLLGGTSEIGLAIVRALLVERPARVVLAGRSPEALERAAAGLRTAGAPDVRCVAWDARELAGLEERLGPVFADQDVDLVVLAAGVLGEDGGGDVRPGPSADLLAVNVAGAGGALLLAADRLRAQGHGQLLVLSSVAGERVRSSNAVYGASKAGLDALAQGLADRLAGSGVTVTVVRPGFVRTRMTAGLREPPLATDAEGVARDALAGLRAGAHTVWSPPAMRWVMLALRMVPRRLWRRLPI